MPLNSYKENRIQIGLLNVNGKDYRIYEGVNTIGRHTKANINIKRIGVSEQQAIILHIDERTLFISDLRSVNGTFIKDEKLIPYKLYPLESGTDIKFGGIKAHFSNTISENETVFCLSVTSSQECIQPLDINCTQEMNGNHDNCDNITHSSTQVNVEIAETMSSTLIKTDNDIHELPTQLHNSVDNSIVNDEQIIEETIYESGKDNSSDDSIDFLTMQKAVILTNAKEEPQTSLNQHRKRKFEAIEEDDVDELLTPTAVKRRSKYYISSDSDSDLTDIEGHNEVVGKLETILPIVPHVEETASKNLEEVHDSLIIIESQIDNHINTNLCSLKNHSDSESIDDNINIKLNQSSINEEDMQETVPLDIDFISTSVNDPIVSASLNENNDEISRSQKTENSILEHVENNEIHVTLHEKNDTNTVHDKVNQESTFKLPNNVQVRGADDNNDDVEEQLEMLFASQTVKIITNNDLVNILDSPKKTNTNIVEIEEPQTISEANIAAKKPIGFGDTNEIGAYLMENHVEGNSNTDTCTGGIVNTSLKNNNNSVKNNIVETCETINDACSNELKNDNRHIATENMELKEIDVNSADVNNKKTCTNVKEKSTKICETQNECIIEEIRIIVESNEKSNSSSNNIDDNKTNANNNNNNNNTRLTKLNSTNEDNGKVNNENIENSYEAKEVFTFPNPIVIMEKNCAEPSNSSMCNRPTYNKISKPHMVDDESRLFREKLGKTRKNKNTSSHDVNVTVAKNRRKSVTSGPTNLNRLIPTRITRRTNSVNNNNNNKQNKTISTIDTKIVKPSEVDETPNTSSVCTRKSSANSRCRQNRKQSVRKTLSGANENDLIAMGDGPFNLSSPRFRRAFKPKVAFTMMDSPSLEMLICQLGGTVVNNMMMCSVLVTENVKRSLKLLVAVGLSKPICSPKWLYESRKANRFLDPWDFILIDVEAEKKWHFSLRESLARSSNNKKMLEDYTFQILVDNGADVLEAAIEACGGRCVNRNLFRFKNNLVVVAIADHEERYRKLVQRNHSIRVVQPEAIFDGVLRQELQLSKYTIFN